MWPILIAGTVISAVAVAWATRPARPPPAPLEPDDPTPDPDDDSEEGDPPAPPDDDDDEEDGTSAPLTEPPANVSVDVEAAKKQSRRARVPKV